MSFQNIGIQAYSKAMRNFNEEHNALGGALLKEPQQTTTSFADMLKDSIGKVNALQGEKSSMISSFAAGENQNVHELMITMQKAGLAMNLTTAVRNKFMEAFRELSRLQF